MRTLVLLSTLAAGILPADTLTYTSLPGPGGFSYQFTLTNMGDTGGNLFDLFLALPTSISNIATGTIGTPVGWGDPAGGLLFFGPDVNPSTSFIEWAASSNGTFDVAVGHSLGGFSFTSTQSVGTPIEFALNGSTAFAEAQLVAAVPEPDTSTLLAPAMILLLVRRKRRSPEEASECRESSGLSERRSHSRRRSAWRDPTFCQS